jgi:hypothetical protein
MKTWPSPPPAHSMRQHGRRACAPRPGSSQPSRMPATTAAQAPVPQASVSPASRSCTRSRCAAPSTCMKPALTPRAKARVRSISGPSVGHRRAGDVGDAQHRVRVAHRQHRHLDRAARPRPAATARSRPRGAAAGRGVERHARGARSTGAPMSTVTRPSALRAQLEHALLTVCTRTAACRSGRARARSARSSARRCRSARPRRRWRR